MSLNSGLKQTCPIEPRRSTLPKTCFTSPAFFDPRRWLKTPSKLSTEAPESVFLLRPTFRRIEILHCTATPCKPWRLGRPECALINQFFRSILIILVWIFNVPMRPHFGQKWRKLLCPKYTDSRASEPSRKAQSISLNWCHNCWQKLLHFDRCNLSQTSRIAVQYLTNKNPQLRKLLFTYSTQPRSRFSIYLWPFVRHQDRSLPWNLMRPHQGKCLLGQAIIPPKFFAISRVLDEVTTDFLRNLCEIFTWAVELITSRKMPMWIGLDWTFSTIASATSFLLESLEAFAFQAVISKRLVVSMAHEEPFARGFWDAYV